MKRIRAHADPVVLLLIMLSALTPLLTANRYHLQIVSMAAINIVLALGLNVVYGFTGQISFGHGGFYALGAYVSALLTAKLGLPFLPSALATLVILFAVSALVGFPILRLKEHHLGLATLAFGLLVGQVLTQYIELTGGPNGMPVTEPKVAGLGLQPYFFYAVVLVATLAYAFCWSLEQSRLGLTFKAIRGDELAARAAGINTTAYKVISFAIAGTLGGVAGILYAHLNLFISPEVFALNSSVLVLTMVVIGGLGSNLGAFLGALVNTALPEVLTTLKDYQTIIYGALLLLFLVYMPQGLVGWVRQHLTHRREATR